MVEVFMNNKETSDEDWEVLFWLNEYVGHQYIARSLISNDFDREQFLKENADWFCFFNNQGWLFNFKDNDNAILFKLTWC